MMTDPDIYEDIADAEETAFCYADASGKSFAVVDDTEQGMYAVMPLITAEALEYWKPLDYLIVHREVRE